MSEPTKEQLDTLVAAVEAHYEKLRRETPPEIWYGGMLITDEYYEWIRKTFYSE